MIHWIQSLLFNVMHVTNICQYLCLYIWNSNTAPSHQELNINHSVYFRFTSWYHPCCSAGSCTDLCSAGRSDVVRVQEELCTFSRAPYTRQRLLQTNQLTGYRVRWKRADHRPGSSLRRIAFKDSTSL